MGGAGFGYVVNTPTMCSDRPWKPGALRYCVNLGVPPLYPAW